MAAIENLSEQLNSFRVGMEHGLERGKLTYKHLNGRRNDRKNGCPHCEDENMLKSHTKDAHSRGVWGKDEWGGEDHPSYTTPNEDDHLYDDVWDDKAYKVGNNLGQRASYDRQKEKKIARQQKRAAKNNQA
jgi:hypothetical protein